MEITSSILLEKPKNLLNIFIEDYSSICDIDKIQALEYIKTGDKKEELIIKSLRYFRLHPLKQSHKSTK